MDKVLVIGSYNVGLAVLGDRVPKLGETIIGNHFDMGPGGKGSNQAIAISRLGGNVSFLAKVGDDIFGKEAMKLFEREGIDTAFIKVDSDAHTGAGIIFVDKDGHNCIGVAPGANYRLTVEELDQADELFKSSKFLLMQLETPLPVVYHAIRKAKENGVTVILNPAPGQKIDSEYLSMIDILTPNETETEIIAGLAVTDTESAIEAARKLVNDGVKNVIVTLGKQGCTLVSAEKQQQYRAPKANAVDTTGAGDAFNGGLVYALAAGKNIDEAIEFGCKVGAYSVTSIGVVPGLPTVKDIEEFSKKI
jgi:ribokinase